MITVKNLTFNYPGSKHNVFSQFDIELPARGIIGMLGKNGTGKSTLLYLISGLLRPRFGSVEVDGFASAKRQPQLLEDIYIVPEEYNLPNLSLKAYVKIHEDFYPNFSQDRLEKCLKEFEMPTDVNFKQLSMGQKKKVYMSFALASGCSLLLMDEPTNGLDIPSKVLFRQVVAGNMPEDSTLIISTHQVHDIEQLLNHIVIIDHSQVLLNASAEEVTAKYTFGIRQPGDDNTSVLYAEPSLQGNMCVAVRGNDEPETPLNLELLFNAVILGKLK